MSYDKRISIDDMVKKITSTAIPITEFLRCGIYFLINDGVINYVGQSVAVENRISSHRVDRRIPFDRVFVLKSKREKLDVMEAYFIDKLKPPYNRSFPDPQSKLIGGTKAERDLFRQQQTRTKEKAAKTLKNVDAYIKGLEGGQGESKRKATVKRSRNDCGSGIVTPLGFFPTVKWAAQAHRVSLTAIYTKLEHREDGWCIFSHEDVEWREGMWLPKMRGRPPIRETVEHFCFAPEEGGA
jgi:hypothetical protein